MADEALSRLVTAELAWDPKVHSGAIAVTAHGGTVNLRGTVGSPREKHEARKAAERVSGVEYVENELDVRILNEHRREDAELRGDVLQALMLDSAVPTTVDANVRNGQVTLTGVATWKFQRDEAEFVAGNVSGVAGVHNEVALATPAPNAGDVSQSIRKALERDAKLQASNINVDALNGTVRLTGTVNSWSEHDAAVAAAWAAPGVIEVDDRVDVRF
jgi:osmotically-inducible protein OsmY